MVLIDNAKSVLGVAPIDTTGAAQETDIVSFKNYNRARFTIIVGAWAGGTPAVTLKQCTDVADAGVKALGFSYVYITTAGATVKTAVTSNTFNIAATANIMYQIEVKAEDLDVDNGFDCCHLNIASPGANADLICVLIDMYNGDSVSKSPIVD